MCWLGIGVRTEGGVCEFPVAPRQFVSESENMQPYDEELETRIYELESMVSLMEHAENTRQSFQSQGARHA